MKIKFICIKFMTYCNLLRKEIKKKLKISKLYTLSFYKFIRSNIL